MIYTPENAPRRLWQPAKAGRSGYSSIATLSPRELLELVARLRWALDEAVARGDHYAQLLAELLTEPGP